MKLKLYLLLILLISCSSNRKIDDTPKMYYIKSNEPSEQKTTYNYKDLDKNLLNFNYDERLIKFKEQIIIDDVSPFDLRITSFQDTVYILNIHKLYTDVKGGDTLPLYLYSEGKTYLKDFIFPNNVSPYSLIIKNIAVNNKYFFALFTTSLYVFDKETLKLIKEIKTEFSNGKITIINDNLFLNSYVYGICSSTQKNPRIYKIKLENLIVEEIIDFDMPTGGNMTYEGPKRNLGIWSKGYFISDLSDYHIKFYTFDRKLHSEINYLPENWITDKKIVNEIDSSKNFDLFRSKVSEFSKISFIECIDFIDDNTFLLFRSDSQRYNIWHDIWRYDGNKWNLLFANIGTKIIDKMQIGKNYLADGWFNYSFFKNNTFSILSANPYQVKNNLELEKMTYGELQEKMNDYYINNNSKISINIYDFLKGK